jgi:NADPH:quinone reductase
VRPEDEVYFCDGGFGPTPGTYQEIKIVDERYLARKPERLSFAEAAAAPLVTITAWEALHGRARVSAELCIDYTHEDVGAKLRGWTGTDGADVVHDTVGGKTFTACFSLTRPYGDLVSNVESPWEEKAISAMHDTVPSKQARSQVRPY